MNPKQAVVLYLLLCGVYNIANANPIWLADRIKAVEAEKEESGLLKLLSPITKKAYNKWKRTWKVD